MRVSQGTRIGGDDESRPRPAAARIAQRIRVVIALGATLCVAPRFAIAQAPVITDVSVSGTSVIVRGGNFGQSQATATLGTIPLVDVVVSPTGDEIVGTLTAMPAAGSYLLTLVLTGQVQGNCATPQPAPNFVCVGQGWVPLDHPLANRQIGSLVLTP